MKVTSLLFSTVLALAATQVFAKPSPQHLRNVRDAAAGCSDEDKSLGTNPSLYVHNHAVEDMMPRLSCKEWNNYTTISGLYRVSPSGGCEIKVYCDMCLMQENESWMVIQRRRNGSVDFHDKGWQDYKRGFGDYLDNYWMGLEKIHEITSSGSYELFIGFTRSNYPTPAFWKRAIYTGFSVESEDTYYKMTYDTYKEGTVSANRLEMHNNQPFTTYDSDNDGVDDVNCAESEDGLHFGGWWFGGSTENHDNILDYCLDSNLNGKYYDSGDHGDAGNGIWWNGEGSDKTSLLKTIMAIRRVD